MPPAFDWNGGRLELESLAGIGAGEPLRDPEALLRGGRALLSFHGLSYEFVAGRLRQLASSMPNNLRR